MVYGVFLKYAEMCEDTVCVFVVAFKTPPCAPSKARTCFENARVSEGIQRSVLNAQTET